MQSPWRWTRGLLVALATALAACAAPGPGWEKPPATYAREPAGDGPLAVLEQTLSARHGPASSGFHLLHRNDEALRLRLALIDAARDAIDAQYYVWFGDAAGQLMMRHLIAAADRGVRVRVLFDDLNTLLHDMGSIELRDEVLARIDAHPRIEIRVFNPWRERSLAGRALEGVSEFGRLNRRMHNKQFVVDNRAVIIGGRNIGDEYFGLHEAFNFFDLDVLGVGPVARQASEAFDGYWNSGWVQRIPRSAAAGATPGASAATGARPVAADEPARPASALVAVRPVAGELEALSAKLLAGRSVVRSDDPARSASRGHLMPQAFRELLRSARREVLITNAYIIPDEHFVADLRELAGRGVEIRVLTNSLASHDVPAVNSHYETWRAPIVRAGVRLHELRADAALRERIVDVAPVRARFVGLHVKAMVVDRRHSFIGSMNLDPRSETINAEMGVLIDSAPLAARLAGLMDDSMTDANSWRVDLAADGSPRWTSAAGELTAQPARSLWQRVENLFFKLFPPSLY